ncbi:flagellar biosynthesis protein FliQ [Fervidobacterium sp. SC_NGM5_O18]|jgi:flagellar biosynthetic protein FliQ|uniref:Flagellar biosynthetic protein FliQ n=1 Tax=Fervidobacterium pennivorans TaxID=93466 RepID=A0A172T1Q9_FERPE|nr:MULTISPECIES: flagellar biosynthesis protein FliQ [Fervidobacterium]ANE40921.1 flagellar biosynthesis protein FliQ [Fervidobacterium pennivorans]NPU89822.1 flagellar biosynthesis protein FliQ [Fervidobacterium sp.]PHJ13026.1 flagellar biosynthesis protein FliQ [Fervidobacterium sp. SC_NGM5_O18]
MTLEVFLDIVKHGIQLLLMLITPPLLVSLAVGILISIFQAATQIHEQTLTFAPRIIVVFLTLMFLFGWMIENMLDFIKDIIVKYMSMI